ncbi:MAG: flagellar protein FlaG [Candidatus Lustribacter sp.]|jgi:uncharacterized FlaG/YvyC family protein
MDVPAATAAAPPPPLPAQPAAAPEPPVAGSAPTAGTTPPGPTAGPVPVKSTASAPGGSSASNQPNDTTLSPVVAKLFNAAEANVEVSFQVLTNPDEVVTVFTDKSTGKEIIQFPSQALIALAEMYDKDAGKVLDKSV